MDFSQYKQLEFRRKFWRILGAAIYIKDPNTEQTVGYIEMKAWKLREDIRVFSDDTKSQELLRIHARNIIDFGATYDVYDGATGQALFYFRRQGLKSAFVRDHWNIFTTTDQPYASVEETSSGLALARRWISIIPYAGEIADLVLGFIPQTYQIHDSAGNVAAFLAHRKNPFIVKFGLDTAMAQTSVDSRLPIAAVALLSTIDANKN